MLEHIFLHIAEALLVYALISWVLALVVLIAHRAATPTLTLRQLAARAVVVAISHPLDLAYAIYHFALRAIAAFRR